MTRNNKDFEDEIVEYLKDMVPPQEEIENINPWKEAMGSISIGLVLTSINLNFLLLQYILPTIGVISLYLGFRSLREENKYFKSLWLISIGRLVLHSIILVWIATPLNSLESSGTFLGLTTLIIQLVMFLLLNKAIREVYQKLDKKLENSPLLLGALWILLVAILSQTSLSQSWLAFIFMILFYILIIRTIYSLGENLDDVGYAFKNSSVKLDGGRFAWTYFILSFALALSLNVLYNHQSLEAEVFEGHRDSSIRQELEEEGFPAEALKYLKDEDLEEIKNPINIEVNKELFMFDPRTAEEVGSGEDSGMTFMTEKPGNKNLESITIYIEMSDQMVYVLQYFNWQTNKFFTAKPYWQEAIEIWGSEESSPKEIIDQGLFYTKKGKDYLGDYPRLSLEEIESSNFFGTYTSSPILGGFSFPFGSKDQGGYVFYKQKIDAERGYIASGTLNYYHSQMPFKLPYERIEEKLAQGHYFMSNKVKQHYTTYESLNRREDP